MLHHSSDIDDPFSVLDLWELHGSSLCTSESQASVVPRTGVVGTGRCIVTATPTILSMYWIWMGFEVLNRTHLPFTTGMSTTSFSHCTALGISISLLHLLDGGHCLCTTGCRASPRHELLLDELDQRHLRCLLNSQPEHRPS